MDIRTRLRISNIVMIIVPAVVALAVGALCAVIAWAVVSGGAPLTSEAIKDYLGILDMPEPQENHLKVVVVVAALIVVIAVVAATAVTDFFMVRFVFKRITQPLGQLSTGVEQIRKGNLDYRIDYAGRDEFAPLCDAFDEMAQRLAQSVERDRRGEEARKQLITSMSHDLRSPLTSIRGYAEGLRDGVAASEESRRHYLEVILDKTSEIERKITQLLTLTKLDMDEFKPRLEPVELDKVVRGFLDPELADLAEQGMDITYDLQPTVALADPSELERILGNLIENSMRYRTAPRVSVTIGVRSMSHGKELSVSDDGPGVSDQDMAHIFDALYRGDTARSSEQPGSGLGLSIVAASVDRMGGTVRAERSSTGGLSIIITLRSACDAPEPEIGEVAGMAGAADPQPAGLTEDDVPSTAEKTEVENPPSDKTRRGGDHPNTDDSKDESEALEQ